MNQGGRGGAPLGALAPGQRWSAARKREVVLRLMRDHALFSPHRARTRPEAPYERHITTEAPNIIGRLGAS